MNNYLLTINNKEVFEFYQKHSLNFEHMNMLFFNVLQTIITTSDNSFNNNIANQLLTNLSSISSKIETIDINVNKYKTDMATLLNIKFNDYRKEYISDLKLILTSNNIEQIAPLIRDTNNNLIDKTTLMINELLPKNQDYLAKDINSNFQLLQSSLINETTKLLSSCIDKQTISDFLNNINNNMSQSHNTLTTLISSSENRIENKLCKHDNKIDEIKQTFTENNHSQQFLQNSVTEMLKKFEKGIGKGTASEHITYNILLTLFPCAQIDHVGGEIKETGDIILIRNNKPKILIENKDHTSCNVPKIDVEKFIRDCEIQNCCGIMFAQHRGIANKQNYEIQINNGNILLYVHDVNFDVDKIKISIEIVEQFKIKLDEININNNSYLIDIDTLEEINKEFVSYINQKNGLLKIVKDFNEKMNSSINDLKMPRIEKFLSSNFATASNQGDNICKYCEKFIPKSLLQHYRYCSSKKEIDNKTIHNTNKSDIIIESNNDVLLENIVIPKEHIISSIQIQKKKNKSIKA